VFGENDLIKIGLELMKLNPSSAVNNCKGDGYEKQNGILERRTGI
jgi:hypothetical protein